MELLDDVKVDADERTRVEEWREDTREAKAPKFLDAVDDNIMVQGSLCL